MATSPGAAAKDCVRGWLLGPLEPSLKSRGQVCAGEVAQAFPQVLEGQAEITIAGTPLKVAAGELVLMPANRPHAVHARTRFKMLLTMIRSV